MNAVEKLRPLHEAPARFIRKVTLERVTSTLRQTAAAIAASNEYRQEQTGEDFILLCPDEHHALVALLEKWKKTFADFQANEQYLDNDYDEQAWADDYRRVLLPCNGFEDAWPVEERVWPNVDEREMKEFEGPTTAYLQRPLWSCSQYIEQARCLLFAYFPVACSGDYGSSDPHTYSKLKDALRQCVKEIDQAPRDLPTLPDDIEESMWRDGEDDYEFYFDFVRSYGTKRERQIAKELRAFLKRKK